MDSIDLYCAECGEPVVCEDAIADERIASWRSRVALIVEKALALPLQPEHEDHTPAIGANI